METPRSQTKIGMSYGLMYGLAGIVVLLVSYFMGADFKARSPQYIGYVIQILFIYLGIKTYRDQDLGGFITYGKSVSTGLLISIFGGIVTGAFTLIFFTYIAPEMTQRILDAAQQSMSERGMSEDQIAMGMEYTKKFMTPGWLFLFSILGAAFMGLIFSLIISIFTKKEANPFGQNQI